MNKTFPHREIPKGWVLESQLKVGMMILNRGNNDILTILREIPPNPDCGAAYLIHSTAEGVFEYHVPIRIKGTSHAFLYDGEVIG